MRIPNRTHLIKILLGISLITASCGQSKPTEQIAIQNNIPIKSTFLIARGDQSAKQIVRQIELQPKRGYPDFVDLGTAYLWIGEYLNAAEAYEMACREASNQNELTGALMNKAISLGYAKEMNGSLEAIDLAAKLQPNNLDIAWLRLALYRYQGDPLGIAVSMDHLFALDPSQSGSAILEPITAGVMISIGLAVIFSATQIINIVLVPPENRAEVIIKIWGSYSTTMKTFGGLAGNSQSGILGKFLLDQYKVETSK